MSNLFTSARLKLTLFYLTIVMVVSIAFSGIIYQSVGYIFTHRLEMIQDRMRRMNPRQELSLIEDVRQAKSRVLATLIYINGGILVFAASGGYWLARQTLKPIKKAMEDQKRFVADASHELRTPLTVLRTSIEVGLRDKKLTSKNAKKIISDNLESVDEMQSLVDHLLNLAKYQQNGHQLNFEKISLPKVINQAVKKIKPIADNKKIKIKLDLDDLEIKADEQSLEKMAVVFLDNAVKYTDRNGKINIEVKKNKNKAIIKISDNGRGIPKKNLPYIFDRFYRVDDSRCKNDVCGYGLGLSVAKKIIDLHHGSVLVDSTVGEGTIFTIKLQL